MTDPKETAARVRLEAYALRRVLDLDAPTAPKPAPIWTAPPTLCPPGWGPCAGN